MNKQNIDYRYKVLTSALIPQSIMLVISILWILIFPADSIKKFLFFDITAILKGFILGLVLAIGGYLYYLLAKRVKPLYAAAELFENVLSPVFKNLAFVDIVFLSLVSGVIEEIFFRGLLFPKVGIIISSLAFGLLHLPGKKFWIYALWASASGALFAWFLYTTNCLYMPITAHFTNNLIGMILLKSLSNKK